uniref:Uncharacterized protein n=1 Tax=Romanomermis culicivorax TaxID=13658 RepID=A0A915JQV4_ROMCU
MLYGSECCRNLLIDEDKDRAILCDYCNNWFYCKCANIADQVYNYLKASNQPSFCPSCLPAVNQYKRFDDLENRIASLEKELVAKITGLEQKLAAAQQKSTVPPDLLSEVKDFAKAIGFDPKEIIGAKRSSLEVTCNNVTLPRIVEVKCVLITAKNDLIKNANLSQKNIERSEKIRARPDLTFAEREQCRLLRK